uniref:Uncharacterized protein n=1 Tax=Anopheles marajoara TaxID=58244 RepID=A0A2M4C2N9_9DIPT
MSPGTGACIKYFLAASPPTKQRSTIFEYWSEVPVKPDPASKINIVFSATCAIFTSLPTDGNEACCNTLRLLSSFALATRARKGSLFSVGCCCSLGAACWDWFCSGFCFGCCFNWFCSFWGCFGGSCCDRFSCGSFSDCFCGDFCWGSFFNSFCSGCFWESC